MRDFCKKRNVSKNRNCPGQGWMKYLYGKHRPAQARITVAETRILARRDGMKNVPPPYKQHAIPPTYDLGKFKRDLSKRASLLSHMNAIKILIGKQL